MLRHSVQRAFVDDLVVPLVDEKAVSCREDITSTQFKTRVQNMPYL